MVNAAPLSMVPAVVVSIRPGVEEPVQEAVPTPPSWKELERRLTERGTDAPETIHGRLSRAREEFRLARDYDYIVVNDAVENAVGALDAIMTAEHCRPAEQMRLMEQNG